MKTLVALIAIAALSAFSLSFLSFELTTSLLVAVGFAAIVLHDYARTVRPLGTEMSLSNAKAPGRERFRLAA